MNNNNCPLRQLMATDPDATVVMAGELFWSCRSLEQRVQLMAGGLSARGLLPGDVLVASAANSPMLVVLILACLRAGIIILPVNPAFPEARIQQILQQVKARAFWSEAGLTEYSCVDVDLPDNLRNLSGDGPLPEWDDQRLCNLVLTSGSSGTAKAAAFSFSCHRASAEQSRQSIDLQPGDSWLLSLPLYHIGGLAILFRCLLAGACMVFPDHRRALAQTLKRRPVTHLSLVNTQLYRLLQQSGFDFTQTSVRQLLLGGGYISSELVASAQNQGVEVLTSYGMTEMSSQICTGHPEFLSRGGLTSGETLANTEVRIVDGAIQVRGPQLFRGYWDGQKPHCPVTDGWFNTGDRGCWHKRQLQVTGRSDSQFISGGENIQPETIEYALMGLDNITRVVVVPLASDEFGARPAAFVDCAQDSFAPEQWRAQLRFRLPGFMVPDYFFPWPCDNSFSTLKINRCRMTQLAGKLAGQGTPCHNIAT